MQSEIDELYDVWFDTVAERDSPEVTIRVKDTRGNVCGIASANSDVEAQAIVETLCLALRSSDDVLRIWQKYLYL